MYIALSPAYSIRNEANASFLIRVDKIINLRKSELGTFCIPPFIGYILSHIGDYEYPESVNAVSVALNVSSTAIDNFVRQLVDNDESKEFVLSDTQSVVLPQGLLRQCSEHCESIVFEDEGFNGLGDYVITRPNVPLYANLMVTTKCTTDCIYCYANRKLHPAMETEKILDLIRELRNQGTINVTLTGGDIFAHPDWHAILKCMRQYGYKPYLSTKTPLNYEQIKYLRDLGYDEIQFSLDSVDPNILMKLINVRESYLERLTSFLNCSSELGLDVLVRSVLTKMNSSRDKISFLYKYLSEFKCVKEWVMTPAFFSKYKESEYKSLEVNNDDLIWVFEFSRRSDLAFGVGLSKISANGYELKKSKTTEDYVCQNQVCMANTTCISILANGDCSVCEMLYDNPEYLIGNVHNSSIREIWNSEKAMGLYRMTQNLFPEASPCRRCDVFGKCRNEYGKRVCYLDIAKSGKTKWYPDPRCPEAEEVDLIL